MKKTGHLPLYGLGPLYVSVIILLTLAAVLFGNMPVFKSGKLITAHLALAVIGIIFIAAGVFIWIQAVIVSKLDANIKENRLVTDGVYAWVRNPIYSAFMIICTGVLFIVSNVWFFVLPFVYWIFMTVLMKNTEEKWLEDLYGQEYEDYCRSVNRCWPWIPKKHRYRT